MRYCGISAIIFITETMTVISSCTEIFNETVTVFSLHWDLPCHNYAETAPLWYPSESVSLFLPSEISEVYMRRSQTCTHPKITKNPSSALPLFAGLSWVYIVVCLPYLSRHDRVNRCVSFWLCLIRFCKPTWRRGLCSSFGGLLDIVYDSNTFDTCPRRVLHDIDSLTFKDKS